MPEYYFMIFLLIFTHLGENLVPLGFELKTSGVAADLNAFLLTSLKAYDYFKVFNNL